MDYIIVIFLVSLSGLFSGLTLGLLGLDKNELKRKISLGNKKAAKVYTVRKHGNLLLCTLLLGNVAVNSTLAIFLGNIASGVMAGIIATGLIVVFGEIIPQATFSRYALEVGAKTAWLVRIMMFIMLPACWPIAWVLDKTLGEEMPTVYSKKELMKIVEEHEGSQHSDVDADEERVIQGALSFSDKNAKEVMTPRTVLFLLEESEKLTKTLLNKIRQSGFTRIPVYKEKEDNITRILLAKDLIGIAPGRTVRSAAKQSSVETFTPKTKLDDILKYFLTSRSHLAMIIDEYGTLQGAVSLEDIIEEIIKVEILDETDKVADLQKKARKRKKKK